MYDARTCGVLEKSCGVLNNYKKAYQPVNFYVFLPFNPAMAMGGWKLQIYDASYVCCPRTRKLTKKNKFSFVPGLAIQWGMIGDVGVAVEKFGNKVTAVGGTLPQRMSSCLDSMDQFLCQSKPVVSSFVPASVSMEGQGTETQVQRTLMESVLRVLGT